MHHVRMTQEKIKMQEEIKKLQKTVDNYEPTIKHLQQKYANALKDKTMKTIERDRYMSKVESLEKALDQISFKTNTGTANSTIPSTGQQQKKQKQLSISAGKDEPPVDTIQNPYLKMDLPAAKANGYRLSHNFQAHSFAISS
jgi:chromosome segregation ATPase